MHSFIIGPARTRDIIPGEASESALIKLSRSLADCSNWCQAPAAILGLIFFISANRQIPRKLRQSARADEIRRESTSATSAPAVTAFPWIYPRRYQWLIFFSLDGQRWADGALSSTLGLILFTSFYFRVVPPFRVDDSDLTQHQAVSSWLKTRGTGRIVAFSDLY